MRADSNSTNTASSSTPAAASGSALNGSLGADSQYHAGTGAVVVNGLVSATTRAEAVAQAQARAAAGVTCIKVKVARRCVNVDIWVVVVGEG